MEYIQASLRECKELAELAIHMWSSHTIEELEKDFGVILLTDTREHVFKLVNTGNKPLVIYDVVTSCGCTKAEYSKAPVRPGETLDLKVMRKTKAVSVRVCGCIAMWKNLH